MAVNLIDSTDIKVVQSGTDIDLEFDSANLNSIIDSRVAPLNTYSTSETKIGTWIDGKPLYRVVVSTTTPSSSSVTSIGSISSLNYSKIVNVYGFLYTSSQAVPLNFIYGSEQGMVYIEGNNIMCRITASSYYSKTCYVIIEYTKTTD